MSIGKRVLEKFGLYLALITFALPLLPLLVSADQSNINAWWPTNGAHMSGTQPFKAQVPGLDPSQYQMYWQVDGGQLNQMSENDTDYPHMEASVDLSGWNWHGSGPYQVTFVAKQGGQTIGQVQETIYVDGNTPSPAPTQQLAAQTDTQLLAGANIPAPSPTQTQQQSMIATTPVPITVSAPVTQVVSTASINAWWPTTDAHLSGVQPFKALLSGVPLDQYQMYWQVDGGQLNLMQDSTVDSPHKEASVDVSGWSWQTSGNYTITFVAKDLQGNTIAQISEPVLIGSNAQPQTQTPTSSSNVVTTTSGLVVRLSQPNVQMTASAFAASAAGTLYVDPNSDAAKQAQSWGTGSANGQAMQKLASEPTAVWFGNWNSDVKGDVNKTVSAAASQGSTPVLVAYNIPQRDCGGYSAGGTSDYKNWISQFAAGIGSNNAIVILEPDALAQMSCLSSSDQQTRMGLLNYAVSALKANANTKVYLDAGHSGWIDAGTMASELQQAGVQNANGFSLNVSNFNATSDEINYGELVSAKVGGAHFVVDTSRNGNGSNGQWCNPSGRAIGQAPTLSTGNSLVDAFLWVKTPGESDGNCNGGPSAGVWWPDYALQLVENAH